MSGAVATIPEPGSRLKIARALATLVRMLRACLCSKSSWLGSRPETMETERARALKTHWAEGPHPPVVSAIRILESQNLRLSEYSGYTQSQELSLGGHISLVYSARTVDV